MEVADVATLWDKRHFSDQVRCWEQRDVRERLLQLPAHRRHVQTWARAVPLRSPVADGIDKLSKLEADGLDDLSTLVGKAVSYS